MASDTNACPICETYAAITFLKRKHVPVHQNLVLDSREAAVAIPKGELHMRICRTCGFVFNASFDARKLSYGADYDNTQSCSPRFSEYMSTLVEALVHDEGVRNCSIVEVGCGAGEFLRRLVSYPGCGNKGTGFDPSYRGLETDLDGRVSFQRRFYDERCTDVPADVVVCRHVIEHTPAPLDLLHTVRRALRKTASPRIFFETPCVEWILKNHVVWDFFYEHCSLFTRASLSFAFTRAGFSVNHVRHKFGGQYLWLSAGKNVERSPAEPGHSKLAALAEAFSASEAKRIERWGERIDALSTSGNVAVWGAGAKGTTFVHLIDPDGSRIACLVDLNPNKQGKFVPGTGHRIIAPEDLKTYGITTAILMNPNYLKENTAILSQLGMDVELVTQ